MNIFSFLSTVAVFVYGQLGLYVYRRLDKLRGGRLFFAFSLLYAVWSLGYAFMSSAPRFETAWFILHAISFSYTLSAPLFIHFVAHFTQIKITPPLKVGFVVLYAIATVFAFKAMISGLVVADLERITGTIFGPVWIEVSRMDPWAFAYSIYYNACVVGGLLLLSVWAVSSNEVRAREQGRALVLSFSATLLLIAYNAYLEPRLPPQGMPRIPHLITLVFVGGVVYAIHRYDFLRSTPRAVAKSVSWREFTKREKEVTVLLLEGQSYKEIAGELCISMNTVKSHVEHIYRKTEVSSRAQLTAALVFRSQ